MSLVVDAGSVSLVVDAGSVSPAVDHGSVSLVLPDLQHPEDDKSQL